MGARAGLHAGPSGPSRLRRRALRMAALANIYKRGQCRRPRARGALFGRIFALPRRPKALGRVLGAGGAWVVAGARRDSKSGAAFLAPPSVRIPIAQNVCKIKMRYRLCRGRGVLVVAMGGFSSDGLFRRVGAGFARVAAVRPRVERSSPVLTEMGGGVGGLCLEQKPRGAALSVRCFLRFAASKGMALACPFEVRCRFAEWRRAKRDSCKRNCLLGSLPRRIGSGRSAWGREKLFAPPRRGHGFSMRVSGGASPLRLARRESSRTSYCAKNNAGATAAGGPGSRAGGALAGSFGALCLPRASGRGFCFGVPCLVFSFLVFGCGLRCCFGRPAT